jgi:hypothetical protein
MPNAMMEGGSSSTPLSKKTVKTPAGTTLPKNYGKSSGGPAKKSSSSSSKSSSSKSKSSSSSSSSKRSSSSGSSSYSSGGGYSSSGGGGGGYSGGSTGSNSTGQVSSLAAPTTPPIPTESAFLGKDSTYLAQMAAMNKALADYRAQMGQSQNQYNTDYASRLNDMNINRQQSLENQADDFASRGMYVSGVYGRDRSDLLGQFSRRQADMDTSRANFLAGLQNDYSNYQSDQQVSMTQAKQDALSRRAAQYGLTAV